MKIFFPLFFLIIFTATAFAGDSTAPVISVIRDYYEIRIGGEIPDFTRGATAADDIVSTLPVVVDGKFDCGSKGIYLLQYSAVNRSGKIGHAPFVVLVTDKHSDKYRHSGIALNGQNTGMRKDFSPEHLALLEAESRYKSREKTSQPGLCGKGGRGLSCAAVAQDDIDIFGKADYLVPIKNDTGGIGNAAFLEADAWCDSHGGNCIISQISRNNGKKWGWSVRLTK